MDCPRDDAAQTVLRSTRAGASSLVTGAVLTKLLNFGANVLVTRCVGRAALGVGALRLDDFLFLGPLVLVREGLRKAAYRVNFSEYSGAASRAADTRQSLVNMSWAAAPIALLLACVFAGSLLADTPEAVREGRISPERYHRAMACTGLAVVLALLSEPMFVLAQAQLRTRARARIETAAVMGKCVAMVVGTVVFEMTIEAFAIANIVYALLVLLGYLALFAGCSLGGRLDLGSGGSGSGGGGSGGGGSGGGRLGNARGASRKQTGGIPRPTRLSDGVSAWDPSLMRTARMFWWQSAQKWLLENGEKVLLIFAGTDDQQDAYVVVSRLGSIVVRILFQPAEEMSLAAFGKLMALERDQAEKNAKEAGEKKKRKQKQRESGPGVEVQGGGEAFTAAATTTRQQASSRPIQRKKSRGSLLVTNLVHTTLRSWLLLLGLIGLTFAVFGPAFSHLALHLLYGSTWSATQAPLALSFFSVYVLFMAVNGICEAFVQGTSTERGLSTYNIWMILFSVLYMGAVMVLLPRYGSIGLVLANIFKMACRILVCMVAYIRPYFRERTIPNFTLSSLLPARPVLAAYAGAAVALQCSARWVYAEGGAAFFVRVVGGGGAHAAVVRGALHVGVGVACLAEVGMSVATSHRDVLEPMFS